MIRTSTFFLLFFVTVSTSIAQTIKEYVSVIEIDKLLDNGPKDNRINYAFGNIRANETDNPYPTKSSLDAVVNNLLPHFDPNDPEAKLGFSRYNNFFNLYSVWYPDPILYEAMGEYFVTTQGIRDALFLPWATEQYGWVTMVHTGGGGNGTGVVRENRVGDGTTSMDWETVFHEFNHTMPGVSDEYTASGGFTNYMCSEGPNATAQKTIDEIPWRNWINEDTPVPTPYDDDYFGEVGLFEGNISGYYDCYRPTAKSCYMGAGGFGERFGQEMCSVCLQRFVCMLYQYVNVIENPLPASNSLEINGAETMTFSVEIVKPDPNTQKYEWFLNGKLIAEQVESVDVEFDACDSYELKLVVTDMTEFVRYDEKFKELYPEPKQSHVWTIDQSAVSNYDLTVSTTVTNIDCSGLANGSISVEPSGGTGAYEIFLDGEASSSPIENLPTGTYSLVVSDANGCSVYEQIEITQDPVLSFDVCGSYYAGMWNLSPSNLMEGGEEIQQVDYLWSTGSTVPTIQVTEGTYSLSVTSSNGCQVTQEVTINEVESPLVVSANFSNSSNGNDNGSISLVLNGGTEPYEIEWYESQLTDRTSPMESQVFTNGFTNSHEAIGAFDNDLGISTDFWADGFNGENYIGFDFETSTEIATYSITSNVDTKGRDAKSWILQGSEDASTWIDIEEVINFEFTERFQRFEFILNQPVSHRYFRLLITENWGDAWLAIQEVEFGYLTFNEVLQFKDKTEVIGLAPALYKYQVKDSNNSCSKNSVEIQGVTSSSQSLAVIQSGAYEVQIVNPDSELTYYWASNVDMTGFLHIGSNFQPEESGQFYVRAYQNTTSTFVSDVKGFSVLMPEKPETTSSGGMIWVVDPKDDYEYIWYDQANGGAELHNGNTYTAAEDGYYFVAARKPQETIDPIDPASIDGINLWMDASDLNGDRTVDNLETSSAHSWQFKMNGNWRDWFAYRSIYQNGLGIVDFATIWYQSIDTEDVQMRTVILAYEESSFSYDKTAPTYGLSQYIPRHSDASQLFSNDAPAVTLDGKTYLNGELVDPLTENNPMEFMILSSIFTELVNGTPEASDSHWEGKFGELITWDVELTEAQIKGVNEFLRKKWLSTADLESARTKVIWGSNPLDDKDQDGFDESEDCDDDKPNINQDAIEICDGIDNNCNGEIDEGFETTYYVDTDGDGFGDSNVTISACQELTGYVVDNTDCDDTNIDINSDQTEIPYNGLDDDCDVVTLDDDLDGDGFLFANDCDDTNADVNSDQTEIPYNGLDDDCDAGTLDDDLDEDGFILANDCDDTNAEINPDAEEISNNGIDDNCDGNNLILDIDDYNEFKINIFPIPALDYLNIEMDYKGGYAIHIYNLLGSKMIMESNTRKIDISTISPGVYILTVVFNDLSNKTMIKRIVIE